MSGYRSIAAVCDPQLTVVGADSVSQLRCTSAYGTDRHASVYTPKRRELEQVICTQR